VTDPIAILPTQAPAAPVAPAAPPWRVGFQAARANLRPGLALAAFALAILIGYYFIPPVHHALAHIANLKDHLGLLLTIPSSALFGGLIPTFIQRLRDRTPWSHILFFTAFWAYKGLEIDLFYRFQAFLFGHDAQPLTIACKVFFDMALYCPLWAVPNTIIIYQFADLGFRWRRLQPRVRRPLPWFFHDVLPILICNWAVWLPTVCVIYALPLALQVPMQNLVLCFWSLLLIFQTRKELGAGS
jgi:hypothetical protein